MATIVKMPKWGLTMTQGTIVDWLVAEGTEVSEGDMLLTVETEKAVDDVGAPASGVLYRIVAPAGSEVAVSGPVALIVAEGETLSDDEIAALVAPEIKTPAATAATGDSAGGRRERQTAKRDAGGRINASPAAKKLAAELGVDLADVEATGPGGRITSDDVQRTADKHVDPSPVESMTRLADGREIHILEAGPTSNLPIAFIHGLGGSLSSWQLVMGGLAEQHRMIAVICPVMEVRASRLRNRPTIRLLDWQMILARPFRTVNEKRGYRWALARWRGCVEAGGRPSRAGRGTCADR